MSASGKRAYATGKRKSYWLGKSSPRKGVNLSDGQKNKISEAQKGKQKPPRTKEHSLNLSKSLKGNKNALGRRVSEETKQKIREKQVGKKRKPHTMETRLKMSEMRKGDRGSNWRGGITPQNRLIRVSLEYKLWRVAVFERDNYRCGWCGAKNGSGKKVILNADHIKPFALYPELRFAIDNGRTLCVPCHKTTDTYGYKTNMLKI